MGSDRGWNPLGTRIPFMHNVEYRMPRGAGFIPIGP